MTSRLCPSCKVKMYLIKTRERYDEFAEVKRRYKTYRCPKCDHTPTFDNDILTKQAADQRSKLTVTKEGHIGKPTTLSKTIDQMEEIECIWCHGVVGRVKCESIQFLEALCTTCIHDYERSIIKPKKTSKG